MSESKIRLSVINNNHEIAEGVSCFSIHEKYSVKCEKTSCPNWISHNDGLNCSIITAQDGPKTLQDIGKIFNLTRMRICQIEKNIRKKIKDVR